MIEKNLLTTLILEGIEKSEGCPLCYLWIKSEEKLMEYLLTNELVMDPGFRERVQASKGFCNRHMHLLYKTAHGGHTEDGRGYALYMQGVIEKIIESLEPLSYKVTDKLRNSNKGNAILRGRRLKHVFTWIASELEQAVKGKITCPACEYLSSLDKIHLHTLVKMLDDKNFRESFKSSKGLCIPHFISAINMICQSKLKKSSDAVCTLIEVEIKQLKTVRYLLSEFIRKQSWNFRNEPLGTEVRANDMALNLLTGVEGLHLQTRSFSTKGKKMY